MHRAHYDSNGNIILEAEGTPVPERAPDLPSVIMTETRVSAWNMIPEPKKAELVPALPLEEKRKTRRPPLAKKAIHETMVETESQYLTTADDLKREIGFASEEIRDLPRRLHRSINAFWKVANAPVHLRNRKNGKPATKLQLFVTDTIRFGGTFALIFSTLFVGINYQSFFQIARAELALGTDIKTEQALEGISGGKADKRNSAAFAGFSARSDSDILAYLPAVGPFEDRLVIPKLGKNVPVVRPSMEALMKQDWKTFENDIQTALHGGVVHYPGSARPGQAGNFFLTGHSSYYPWDDGDYKDVFARLSELVIGDTYSVYYGGDRHTYRVTKKYEVKPSDVSVLDQPTSQRISTLMTCTPVGTTLRRLIVQAEEIDPATGEILKVGEKPEEQNATPLTRLEALPI